MLSAAAAPAPSAMHRIAVKAKWWLQRYSFKSKRSPGA